MFKDLLIHLKYDMVVLQIACMLKYEFGYSLFTNLGCLGKYKPKFL